jgi:hypothetical protein
MDKHVVDTLLPYHFVPVFCDLLLRHAAHNAATIKQYETPHRVRGDTMRTIEQV